MAEESQQNYANHRIFDQSLTIIAVLALVYALLTAATACVPTLLPWIGPIAPLFLVAAIIWLIFRMRAYATRLQDRIIRLEMQLRLQRVLASDLAARSGELELTHLIGLRFASDAELPELVGKILANKSMRSNDIKQLVKNWQADNLRV